MNVNSIHQKKSSRVLFIDMNSFFASCEQQENYWLRKRPVAVCVYTGKTGCIISPSIETKEAGIKLGMRLNEAIQICKDLVPLESNPKRYKFFHVKIINILKRYSNDVIPKSIDEAVVNLNGYELLHPDVVTVAKQIKTDITSEAGDWLQWSIGIAPNTFLAKVASDIQKPNGLTLITTENVDKVLAKLELEDLPGIGKQLAIKLKAAKINSPLEFKNTSAQRLCIIFGGVEGEYWHSRLNFGEVDMSYHDYKSMQAMRHLSMQQRKTKKDVEQILFTLCCTLERRMVERNVFCNYIGINLKYHDGSHWGNATPISEPVQGSNQLLEAFKLKIKQAEDKEPQINILNTNIISMVVYVTQFVPENNLQFSLFENQDKEKSLRKTVYALKSKFGPNALLRGTDVDSQLLKDVIGFGSIKDIDYKDLFI